MDFQFMLRRIKIWQFKTILVELKFGMILFFVQNVDVMMKKIFRMLKQPQKEKYGIAINVNNLN